MKIKPQVRIVQYWDDSTVNGGGYIYRVEYRETFLWVFRYWSWQKKTPIAVKAVEYAESLYAQLVKEQEPPARVGRPRAKTVFWEKGND